MYYILVYNKQTGIKQRPPGRVTARPGSPGHLQVLLLLLLTWDYNMGCSDLGIRKSKFVARTQFLHFANIETIYSTYSVSGQGF